jgi:Zn-dependent protease with chaperone function
MTGTWAVVAAASAGGVLVGLVAAKVVLARAARRLAEGAPVNGADVQAARRRAMLAAQAPAVLAPIAGLAVAAIARGAPFDLEAVFVPLALAALAATMCVLPALLDFEERLRGPGWDRRATGRLWAWATLGTDGPLILGGVACAVAVAAWGGRAHAAWVAAEAFGLGAAATILVVGRLLGRVGRPDVFPQDVVDDAARLDGGAAFPQVVLWRTGGHGTWFAVTLGSLRRTWIAVTDDVLALLPREQMVAVLLHEAGHARLRHIATRKALLLAALLAAPFGIAAAGVTSPWGTFIASFLVLRFGGRLLYRRQEFAADAYAAARAPAEHLGRALVALERAKLVATDHRDALTHPSLRARLLAMKLDADALLRGE